jgi:hypothetical protein
MKTGVRLLLLLLFATLVAAPAAAKDKAATVEGGKHWRLDTRRGPLHVWVPPGYDRATAGIVVHVHGYNTDVDDAWTRQRLARQFRLSGQNAMFLVPQSPKGNDDPVRWPSVEAMVSTVRGAGIRVPRGAEVLVGHSGAFRSVAAWIGDRRVRQVILLDALYGMDDAFRDFVERGGRLVLVSQGTLARAQKFLRGVSGAVKRDRVPERFAELTKKERRARVLHLVSQYGHAAIMDTGKVLPVVLRLSPLRSL